MLIPLARHHCSGPTRPALLLACRRARGRPFIDGSANLSFKPNHPRSPPTPTPQADFGLSKHKYNTFCSNVHDLRGTLPYMAPEMIMDHTHVTEKADVWSLGVVFWEVSRAGATACQPARPAAPCEAARLLQLTLAEPAVFSARPWAGAGGVAMPALLGGCLGLEPALQHWRVGNVLNQPLPQRLIPCWHPAPLAPRCRC